MRVSFEAESDCSVDFKNGGDEVKVHWGKRRDMEYIISHES